VSAGVWVNHNAGFCCLRCYKGAVELGQQANRQPPIQFTTGQQLRKH
jgi:hypothetical protein